MSQSDCVWRIFVRAPATCRRAVEDILESHCFAIASYRIDEGVDWRVEGFTFTPPDRQAYQFKISHALGDCESDVISTLRFELLPQRDWLSSNIESFPPFKIRRYFVAGSHAVDRTPAGAILLNIESGTAFGSGEHPTTMGCLMQLDQLAKSMKFQRLLDMGCGSGILAIAMAKTWRRTVTACDIDPEAVRVTHKNARKNNVQNLVRVINGPGFRSQYFNSARPFDLIVANILARPLIGVAADIEKHLRGSHVGGARVILSGVLKKDARWVMGAYRARGFQLLILENWATMTFSR